MKKSTLSGLVLLSTLLVAIHFLSSVALFFIKFGFSVTAIQEFYRPDLFNAYAQPKGGLVLLKVALPHFFAMGMVYFVIGHFLLFLKSGKVRWRLVWATGLALFAYNILPFLIVYVGVSWSYLVLPTFVAMTAGLCQMLFVISKDAISDFEKSTQSDRPGLRNLRPSFKNKM